jgi:nicotinamidase-related amidase
MANTHEKTALLVMDVQPGIIDLIADKENYLEAVKVAVDAAHQNDIPVIYVVVGFRPGRPEISSYNKGFGSMKPADPDPMINPQPVMELADSDIVVTKRRISAFTGSDLAVVLSGQGVGHLVLAGIATSGVVLSTIREAADKDYGLSVLSDLCADRDDEVHRVLTEKVFPRQATVTTSKEWRESLGN